MSRNRAKLLPEDAPDEIKEFMLRNNSTWASATNGLTGQTTVYLADDFVMPAGGVLTPEVTEYAPGAIG